MIRRTAEVGDIIVGLGRRSETVVYVMQVAEVMNFVTYWRDQRFGNKRPKHRDPSPVVRRGDNIYEPFAIGEFRQQPSLHSHPDGTEDPVSKRHDLGGIKVLLANRYAYFGREGAQVPDKLNFLAVGRGHRCRFTADEVACVVDWFKETAKGVLGAPAIWPVGDDSWRQS